MTGRHWLAAIGFIALSQTAGLIGSVFTRASIPTWFATLERPAFAPPNWVFGPVWTLLYAFMGIAAFLVYRYARSRRELWIALSVFGVQLILNTLWSILFFGLQNPEAALIEIIVLWLAIVATIAVFWRTSRVAAVLLLPYLAWVTFATYLNYSFAVLN